MQITKQNVKSKNKFYYVGKTEIKLIDRTTLIGKVWTSAMISNRSDFRKCFTTKMEAENYEG